METKQFVEYEAPRIETISDEQILEELGEAQACHQYLPDCGLTAELIDSMCCFLSLGK